MTSRITKWIDSLDEDQLRQAAISMLRELIITEDVVFNENDTSPYWEASGEDII